jgi:SagB-type dehydrogenase family enzyme
VSKLLHFTYGITGAVPTSQAQDQYQYFRAAPSAGALYPLEIYLVVWRIEGVESGIYHYFVADHTLEIVRKGDFCRFVGEYTFSPDIAQQSSALLIISAMFQRTMFKYNERGYRFVFLDAGHVAQNLYLMATAINCGVLPIGGFLDDELNRLLEIDGVNESVIYPIFVGTVRELSSITKL